MPLLSSPLLSSPLLSSPLLSSPLRSSPLRSTRRQRAAWQRPLVLLAALAALTCPGLPAHAGTVVSNLSETNNGSSSIGYVLGFATYTQATAFTTGPATSVLESVTASFLVKRGNPANFKASLYTNSSGVPGSKIVDLSGSAPDTAGNHTYTCPNNNTGCNLAASTTYHLVFSADNGGDTSEEHTYRWNITSSDNETRTPSNNGWTIADTRSSRTGSNSTWQSDSDVGQFSVATRPATRPDPRPDPPPFFSTGAGIPAQIVNAAFSLTLPRASGGAGAVTYTLTPALPQGFTFNPETRTLSGTPTQPQPATTYTYTATDANGDSASLTFTIMVPDLQPTFGTHTIGDRTYVRDRAIGPLTLPAASSGNGTLTYALTPALPEGLTFDAATRTLSGTPTGARPATTYTYTATDADVSEPDVARLTFTIEVVLSAAEQAIIEDGLAAQGRALLSGATGVIGERFRNPGASSVAGAEVAACLGNAGPGTDDAGGAETECATGLLTTVAQAMLGMSGAGGRAAPWGLADADETRPGLVNGGAQPAWDWESLIWGRSFALPLNAQGVPGSAWTLWGAGDIQGFEGAPRQSRYDGQVRSLYLGVDAQWQAQWLAGAALAQSWGETDYVAEPGGSAGQVETTLTSIYPYVRGTLGAGLEVWAIGGYGRGEAEHTQAGAAGGVDTRDLTMAMGAAGVRQPMTEVGGAQVALVGGAGYLSLATEDGDAAIADLDVAVNRARMAVEATWTAGGLTPYVQVGGRYDGGDGQTGAGLETVAGVRYTSERLEFEAKGRWLATHAAEGYTEYGGLARLAVKPQADGTGFRLAVAPRWGAVGDAGVLGGGAALLGGGAMPGLGVNGMPSATTRALMLESELGYGVAVFEGHGVLTPYGGVALTGNETRQYRLGARLGMAQWLNLSLEGTRREATGPQPADQGVQLQFEGRF